MARNCLVLRNWYASTSLALRRYVPLIFAQCLHQMHRDIVFNYPPGIEQLGHTPRTLVPALYVKDKLITVQGHPEFNGDIVANIAKSRFDLGLFDKDLYEDAMSMYPFRQLPISRGRMLMSMCQKVESAHPITVRCLFATFANTPLIRKARSPSGVYFYQILVERLAMTTCLR